MLRKIARLFAHPSIKSSKQIGKVAFGVYMGYSALDFTLIFLLVRNGVNVDPLLSFLPEGIRVQADGEKRLIGEILLSYGIHKTLLLPARAFLTAATTPYVVRLLRRRNLMK